MRKIVYDEPDDLPFDRIVARLDGVTDTGRSVMACCPAHSDSTPSLHVTETEDLSVLLNCFGACDYEDVLEAINLAPKDLYASEFALATHGWHGSNQADQEHQPRRGDACASLGRENADLCAYLEANRASRDDILWLAENLGVTRRSLREIQVGYDPGRDAFLFPERNGRREVVGVVRRYRDGRKRSVKGSKRGLTIPSRFSPAAGAIYLSEGPSDVAAMLSAGLNALGRPQAHASDAVVNALAELLPDEGCRVFVVADGDEVGVAAAKALAGRLVEVVESGVWWAKPAAGFKDVRAQMNAGRWDLGLVKELVFND